MKMIMLFYDLPTVIRIICILDYHRFYGQTHIILCFNDIFLLFQVFFWEVLVVSYELYLLFMSIHDELN